MTDYQPQGTPPARQAGWFDPGVSNIQLIYVLYLVSFVVGITGLVGVVLAYLNRGKSEVWLETHYTWAIHTFWIGVLYAFISMLLMFVGIGFLMMILVAIWIVVRCVIGLQAVSRGEPIKNPESWIL